MDTTCYFLCNICATQVSSPEEGLTREATSCPSCGSTVRMRSLMHVLSMELFGESIPVPHFPVDKKIVGTGMSDWETYAALLAEKFSYTNRFFDREPFMDITDPPAALESTLDFLISTDVFEHVAPPVVAALQNARALLKPSGVFIFSVPYMAEGETLEHFPDLFDYHLEEKDGAFTLLNRTRAGEWQSFDDLCFHGGRGSTLELRVFSERPLLEQIAEAGFAPPVLYGEPVMEFGIRWPERLSLPMALRRR